MRLYTISNIHLLLFVVVGVVIVGIATDCHYLTATAIATAQTNVCTVYFLAAAHERAAHPAPAKKKKDRGNFVEFPLYHANYY